jgi:hypothetical protein
VPIPFCCTPAGILNQVFQRLDLHGREHNGLAFLESFHGGKINGHITKRDGTPPALEASNAFPITPSNLVFSGRRLPVAQSLVAGT